jgi:hypothetical protein
MRVGGVEADDLLDLLLDALGLGGRQVGLVEDGDDLVVGVDGLVDIGQRLRLDALEASTTSSEPSQARRERETS